MLPDPKEARADRRTRPPSSSVLAEETGSKGRRRRGVPRSRCPGHGLSSGREPAGSCPRQRTLRQATPGRPWDLGSACLPCDREYGGD